MDMCLFCLYNICVSDFICKSNPYGLADTFKFAHPAQGSALGAYRFFHTELAGKKTVRTIRSGRL